MNEIIMDLKGKIIFNQEEIDELRELIRKRIRADRSGQKKIRDRMRKIGFYGSHDFGITDLQPRDLESLIESGRIKVLRRKSSSSGSRSGVSQGPKRPERPLISNSDPPVDPLSGYISFDPEKDPPTRIPDSPGNYIVCLRKGARLPDIGIECHMKVFQGYQVIYTGISQKSIRKRDHRQHFTGNNAGSSTLRKSLGSMFGFKKVPRDKDPNTGKTKFSESDERKLSEWMKSNLIMYVRSYQNPKELEEELITSLHPPLNLSKNNSGVNVEFRAKISQLRVS